MTESLRAAGAAPDGRTPNEIDLNMRVQQIVNGVLGEWDSSVSREDVAEEVAQQVVDEIGAAVIALGRKHLSVRKQGSMAFVEGWDALAAAIRRAIP